MELRQYAKQQLNRLANSLSQALATGDAEAVHQTRVASRRLAEPLELCRTNNGDKLVNQALRQIKKIRKSLRTVRELDVLRASLARSDFELGDRCLSAKDIKAIGKELLNGRKRSLQKAKRKLADIEHKELDGMIDRMLTDLESTKGYRPESSLVRVSKSITAQARQVIESGPSFKGDTELHATRLRLKRLRYMVELKLALSDERNDLISLFKAVQDRLGDWNDQLTAAARLSKIARRGRCMMDRPEFSASLLSHAAARLRRSCRLAGAFRDEWPEFSKFLSKLADKRSGRQKGR